MLKLLPCAKHILYVSYDDKEMQCRDMNAVLISSELDIGLRNVKQVTVQAIKYRYHRNDKQRDSVSVSDKEMRLC